MCVAFFSFQMLSSLFKYCQVILFFFLIFADLKDRETLRVVRTVFV